MCKCVCAVCVCVHTEYKMSLVLCKGYKNKTIKLDFNVKRQAQKSLFFVYMDFKLYI